MVIGINHNDGIFIVTSTGSSKSRDLDATLSQKWKITYALPQY
jgi:hypothetical protein